MQRLADQPEVEHLQVAQAAVDQLARPARGAAGPVPRLDDRRGQAAGHGVEGAARADDAAADDQDVELVLGHPGDRLAPAPAGTAPSRQVRPSPARPCGQSTSTQSSVRSTAFFQPA